MYISDFCLPFLYRILISVLVFDSFSIDLPGDIEVSHRNSRALLYVLYVFWFTGETLLTHSNPFHNVLLIFWISEICNWDDRYPENCLLSRLSTNYGKIGWNCFVQGSIEIFQTMSFT